MTLFSNIRYAKDYYREIDEIVVTRKYAARGFVYLVEWGGKMLLLVNANDYHVALSCLPGKTIDNVNLSGNLMDVPVTESEEKAITVQATGVFRWASKL